MKTPCLEASLHSWKEKDILEAGLDWGADKSCYLRFLIDFVFQSYLCFLSQNLLIKKDDLKSLIYLNKQYEPSGAGQTKKAWLRRLSNHDR